MSMDICPLYQDISDLRPWGTSSGNAGLKFNKFANGWVKTSSEPWKFDAEIKNVRQGGKWLSNFARTNVGDRALLMETAQRNREMIESLGGRVFAFKNISRFAMGMGNAHPLENGLTWHPTLGTPYLPGSSLKGVLRSWELENNGEVGETGPLKLREEGNRAFGAAGGVGELIFFDLLPLAPVKLVREIMTPHYGGYYQDKKVPGDWESPVPIQYLAVEEGCEWQLGVAFHQRNGANDENFWNSLDKLIADALTWAGAGAKTAIGFGRFERVESTERRWVAEQLERQRQAEVNEAREKEYATMSEALIEIRRVSDEGSWLGANGAPNPEKFPPGLTAYLESKTELTAEVLDWLRELFKKRHPNLWENPDETTGKKNKAVHKPTWSNLVKKVKSMGSSAS